MLNEDILLEKKNDIFKYKAGLTMLSPTKIKKLFNGNSTLEQTRETLPKIIKSAKTSENIKYLRSDLNNGINFFKNEIKKQTDENKKKEMQIHLKWLQTEGRQLINDRAKQVKEQENLNESLSMLYFNESVGSSPNLETIENAVAQIQNNTNIEVNLNKIKVAINKEFKCNCEKIYLIENNTSNYFFGACIVPTEKECYKIADNIIRGDENIKFEKCSEFYIELDSKLVYAQNITPREITAVILHEIGHKCISSVVKTELKNQLIQSSMLEGILPENMKSKFIAYKAVLITPIINAFTSTFSSLKTIKEIQADNLAVRYGYGVDLADLIKKLIDSDTHKSLFRRDIKQDKENQLLMNWSVSTMLQFKIRRQQILKDLELQARSEKSSPLKEILVKQLNTLKNLKVNTKGIAIHNKLYQESFKSFVEMRTKGISQLEFDELEVEISRIEYHEDKLYLVNRIHKDIADCNREIIELEKRFSKNGNQSLKIRINELNQFKNKLLALTTKVKSVKIIEKDFEIKVVAPEGYKG